MRVAAQSWELDPAGNLDRFIEHGLRLLEGTKGCDIVVWPENISLELLGGVPSMTSAIEPRWLSGELGEAMGEFHRAAEASSCLLLAGTHFIATERGIENRAVLCGRGLVKPLEVSKAALTQYEIDPWNIVAGEALGVLESPPVGVAVCYDIEFPEAGRALAEAGALVILVPTYTETPHGHWRIRHSCCARAVENQVFVVHAALGGTLGREPVPTAFGSSALIGPPLAGFPEDGLLAETPYSGEEAAIGDLDLARLLASRESGDVRNWHDRSLRDWRVSLLG